MPSRDDPADRDQLVRELVAERYGLDHDLEAMLADLRRERFGPPDRKKASRNARPERAAR